MKKLLFFIIVFYFYCHAVGQNINLAQHGYSDYSYNIISESGRSFYLESITGKSLDSTNIVAVSNSGAIIFKKNISYHDINPPIKLINSSGNSIVIAGTSKCCDCSSPSDKN